MDQAITLLNAGPSPISVLDISVVSGSNRFLKIKYKSGTVVPAHSERVVAAVSYSGNAEGSTSGKIGIKTNSTGDAFKYAEVKYRTRCVSFSLFYMFDDGVWGILACLRRRCGEIFLEPVSFSSGVGSCWARCTPQRQTPPSSSPATPMRCCNRYKRF